ncbi:MAG: hypothetical protein AAFU65_03265, partial [Pseudomonadota bacterium]
MATAVSGGSFSAAAPGASQTLRTTKKTVPMRIGFSSSSRKTTRSRVLMPGPSRLSARRTQFTGGPEFRRTPELSKTHQVPGKEPWYTLGCAAVDFVYSG